MCGFLRAPRYFHPNPVHLTRQPVTTDITLVLLPKVSLCDTVTGQQRKTRFQKAGIVFILERKQILYEVLKLLETLFFVHGCDD